jgi:hypothetical protein
MAELGDFLLGKGPLPPRVSVFIAVDETSAPWRGGNASTLAKRKANRPTVQRLLKRPANHQVSIQ